MKDINTILESMIVPAGRRELNKSNIMWLLRNLGIENANHPDFTLVIKLLKEMQLHFTIMQ